MNKKKCVRCRRILLTKNFYVSKVRKDGLRSYCKRCHYESGKKSKKRYEKSPKGRETKRKYMRRYQQEVINPNYIPKSRKTFEQRFWEKVDRLTDDECWNWKAHVIKSPNEKIGYGRIKNESGNKMILAHRVSWVLHNGNIPIGKLVLHHCDNPKCVNPAHLWIGTQRDNMQDMIKKGRHNNVRASK